MALDYTFRLCIPNTDTYPLTVDLVSFIYESSGGALSGTVVNDASELIDYALTDLIAGYGGTYSYNAIDDGVFTCYTIRWKDLTTDPVSTQGSEFVGWLYSLSGSSSTSLMAYVLTPCEVICDTCQQVTVQACQALYTLTTGLEPATTYTVALYGANGNTYTQEVTSDGSGNISIDTTATGFPQGAFIPESGGYIVKVYANDSLGTPLTLTVGTTQYTCINLNFTYVTTTTPTPTP